MSELSFSCHISAKNHAIKNKASLAQLIKHFLNLYKDKAKRGNKEVTPLYNYMNIDSVMDALKAVYQDEFSEALEDYNKGQIANGHPERCIDDYFEHVNDSNRDLLTEMLLQIGDVRFWDKIPPEKHTEVAEKIYPDLLEELQVCMPDFKIVSVVIHTREETKDENGNVLYNGSPHVDILGVPIGSGYKNGMKKQCAKTRVFTKSSLRELQDKLHKKADEIVKREFGSDYSIADKQNGRNASLSPSAYKWFMEHEKSLLDLIKNYEDDKDDFYENVVNLFPDLDVNSSDDIYSLLQDLKHENDSVSRLRGELDSANETINELQTDLNFANNKINDLERENEELQESLEESEQFGKDVMERLGLDYETVEDPDDVIQALDDLKDNYDNLKRRSGIPSMPRVSNEDAKKNIKSVLDMADGLAVEPEVCDEDDLTK